jgi:RsiW-degrading membrane proteinase PrsW (M82 family)
LIPRRRTRLTKFALAKLGLSVVIVMSLIGALLSSLVTRDPLREASSLFYRGDPVASENILVDHLTKNPDDVDGWIQLVEQRGMSAVKKTSTRPVLPEANGLLLDDEAALLVNTHEWTRSESDLIDLTTQAEGISHRALLGRFTLARTRSLEHAFDVVQRDPPRAADLVAMGEMALDAARPSVALPLLELAARAPESATDHTRALILLALADEGSHEALAARLDDPRFHAVAPLDVLFVDASARNDYPTLMRVALATSFSRMSIAVVITCLVAGLAWLVFLLVVGAAWEWSWRTRALTVVGLVAGMVSGALTLAAVVVMDDAIEHASRSQTTLYHLVYCVAGIGFREELLKLLCIAPVLFFLRHEKHEGVLLIVASLGGLGFAIEENASYFLSALETSPVVIGRFLTANFLHLALTGLVGFHFARALRHGGKEWDTFTSIFLQAVLAHGLYDFLLTADLGEGMSYFAMSVFVWLAQRYLTVLIAFFPLKTRPVALSTTLTVCLAVAVASNFNLVAFEVGIRAALDLTFLGILGNALIAIVFYRSLGEEIL